MLRSIRTRFIIVSFSVVAAIVVALVIGINLSNYTVVTEQADDIIDAIVALPYMNAPRSFDSEPPMNAPVGDDSANTPREKDPFREGKNDRFSEDSLASARFFSVTILSDGTKTFNFDNIYNINDVAASEELASSMIDAVSGSKRSRGYIKGYRYLKTPTDLGETYVFLDMNLKLEANRSFVFLSIALTAAGLAVVFVIIFFLSKIALKPVERAYNKQKRFITDAGHELKTPLTVISANAEILEMESGENEWVDGIKNQVTRLNDMTKNLIMLARMDESGYTPTFADFSLSDAVTESAEPYFSIAEAKQIKLDLQIEKNVSLRGNEEMIRRAVFLLMDNAIKYTENATVTLSLKKKGKGAVLAVENGCASLSEGLHNELFERFYRADSSRNSETGGSGIGLSVVASIAETHGGKALCRVSGGLITFEIVL